MSSERERPKLKRETAGRYRSEDGRYVVQQQSGPWWVMDTVQTDELGQPALHGPYASLSEATDAIATLPAALDGFCLKDERSQAGAQIVGGQTAFDLPVRDNGDAAGFF